MPPDLFVLDLKSRLKAFPWSGRTMTIGATRRIGQLGRVVIPVALRRSLAIREGDLLEIAVSDGHLVLRKIAPQCAICGRDDDLIDLHEKHLCRVCVNAIRLAPESAVVVELHEGDLADDLSDDLADECVEEMRVV
jgi:transcriptional pleiotropic regulator of transition state genes